MLIDDLHLQDPITAFNGGLLVRPDLSVIRENLLPRETVQPVIDILTKHKLDVWIYSDKDWFVPSRHGPHVDREEWTVKFAPIVVPTFEGLLDRVAKIVGSVTILQRWPSVKSMRSRNSVSVFRPRDPNRITWM